MKIERGDILMVNLGQVPGTSLQSGIRPVVVVSNNKA
ncbi:MAG: type II toxin-antitoxin system PemK/MazF family toxin, partial [Blautia coccoides]